MGHPVLTLPIQGGYMRFFIGAFLVFWLGGWLMGEFSAIHELVTGHVKAANAFLLFWLCGWTVGGFFAFAMCYRVLSPATPESMTLSSSELLYDTGRPPIDFMSFNRYGMSRSRINPWKQVFQKRKIINFSQSELGTLRLRDVESGNRLTIDKDSDRIDLAAGLTEIEREWLFAQIKAAYRL